MIYLKCTKRLAQHLGASLSEEAAKTDALLGDWYANYVSIDEGDLIIFVNERTLLTVAVPAANSKDLFPLFVNRVFNLLMMLQLPEAVVAGELNHFGEIVLAKTTSRKVLGSMNEIACHLQAIAEERKGKEKISLSDVELTLSRMLHGPLHYRYPADAAKSLLKPLI